MINGVIDLTGKRNRAPEPGEWQTEVDPHGGVRRFRMVGNIKEYEMEISVNGVLVPQSQLEEHNRRAREAKERQGLPLNANARNQQKKRCPFASVGGRSLDDACRSDCAFYGRNGCELGTNESTGTQDACGKKCPLGGNCGGNCALYENGCSLLHIIKNSKIK